MRRSGVGYEAPPLPSKTVIYSGAGAGRRSVRLRAHNGLHYLVGGRARDVSAPILNPSSTIEPEPVRRIRKATFTTLLTAPTWAGFQRRLDDTTDIDPLVDLLDGVEDDGFFEAAPNLNAVQRLAVRIRLADLGVLTVEDPATPPFFLLHHKLGHRNMVETARYARDAGIKLPKMGHRWCEACPRAKVQRRAQHRVIVDRGSLKPFDKVF